MGKSQPTVTYEVVMRRGRLVARMDYRLNSDARQH